MSHRLTRLLAVQINKPTCAVRHVSVVDLHEQFYRTVWEKTRKLDLIQLDFDFYLIRLDPPLIGLLDIYVSLPVAAHSALLYLFAPGGGLPNCI